MPLTPIEIASVRARHHALAVDLAERESKGLDDVAHFHALAAEYERLLHARDGDGVIGYYGNEIKP